MCQYLDFKNKFASGFGINTFLIMLKWEVSLKQAQDCLIRLIYHLIGNEVFDHIIVIIPSTDQQDKVTEHDIPVLTMAISKLTGYDEKLIFIK